MWQPLQGPQTSAYESHADIVGYGGAAGGGKTDLALGLAVTQHSKTVIFRREATQLRDIIDRSREIIGADGRLNENLHIWRGLPGGRSIEFAGLKDPGDEQKHKGRPRDLFVFDEATEILESQFRFVIAWNRTTHPDQPCKILLTFNPPTSADGEWIIRFFGPWLDPRHANPASPGELRWYAQVDGREVERADGTPFQHGDETIQPQSEPSYLPASRTTPSLERTNYRQTLQSLPEPLRSQMLYGDFSIGIADDIWQVIPTEWVRLAQARWTEERPIMTTPAGEPLLDEQGEPKRVPLTAVGGDVARGGKDKSVLQRRYGNWYDWPEIHPGTDTPNGNAYAALMAQNLSENPQAVGNIDVIGIGASAYDSCAEQGLNVLPINFASGITAWDRSGTMRFSNMRAFAYWSLREALRPGEG
jgi:hypothetical protein